MKTIVCLVGAVVLCAQVMADEIDLSLNSDALRLQYVYEMKSTGLNFDGGWLYHSDNGDVLHAGIHLVDLASSGVSTIKAGLGGRLVYTDGEISKQSGVAVPIGGFARYTPRGLDRLSVSGSLYFAPDILAMGDMDKYEEYTLRVSYNVLRQADLYIGARYVRGGYKNGVPDARYDTGMHVGMSLRF